MGSHPQDPADSLQSEEESFEPRPALVRRHARVRPCSQCHGKLIRIARTSLLQFVISCFGCYPYLCEHCGVRATRTQARQLIAAICLAAVTVSLFVAGLTYLTVQIPKPARWRSVTDKAPATVARDSMSIPPSASHGLANDDIVEFVKSGMTPAFIVTLIDEEESHFQVDTKSITALKRTGVPEDVILAMVRATASKKAIPPGPPQSK